MNRWLRAKEQRLEHVITILNAIFGECQPSPRAGPSAPIAKVMAAPPKRHRIRRRVPEPAPPKTVYGIRCTIRDWWLLDAIYVVLGGIRARCPDDFTRIRRRVKRFAPLPRSVKDSWGRWLEQSGTVLLHDVADDPIALVAHELGHACTTARDLKKREIAGFEIARELSADWYAYKWGFGCQIDRARPGRNKWLHGPPPGSIVRFRGRPFRLTKALVFRPLRRSA